MAAESTGTTSVDWHPCPPGAVALHRRAAQVVSGSALADERMLRCGLWWLRGYLLAAQTRLCCRRGWGWTDDQVRAVAILEPPRSERRSAKGVCPLPLRLSTYLAMALVLMAAIIPALLALAVMDLAVSLLGTPLAGLVTVLIVLMAVVGFGGTAQVAYMRLGRIKPADAYLISNFARAQWAERGSGSLLLGALTGHADQRSWALALHTSPARLVRYYAEHGFTVTGQTRMPWGQTTYLMVRRPLDTSGGTS